MWASVTSIKENCASLNHFYTFLQQMGEIDQEKLDILKRIIKINKADWLEMVRRFDDPNHSCPK
jgi:hypothetical protein